jgi:hypothetical protein
LLTERAASGGAATEAAVLHAEWLRFDKDGSNSLTMDELGYSLFGANFGGEKV